MHFISVMSSVGGVSIGVVLYAYCVIVAVVVIVAVWRCSSTCGCVSINVTLYAYMCR